MSSFDFVYPFQFDRRYIKKAVSRLICSLHSIEEQTDKLNIIIINASLLDILEPLKKYCPEISFKYIYYPKINRIPKGKLLNYAVKNFVETEFFFQSDIDIIYPKNYIDGMTTELFTNKLPNRIITFYIHVKNEKDNYLPYETVNKKYWNSEIYDAPGNGLIHRKSFFAIRGYDERMPGNGAEDRDLNFRISKINNFVQRKDIIVYHQKHTDIERYLTEETNNKLYIQNKRKIHIAELLKTHILNKKEYKKTLVVNNKNWGKLK